MKRFLLAISIQLAVFSLFAADITPQQALDIANTFVQKDKTAQANIRRAPAGTRIAPSIAHKMPSRVNAHKDNVYIINLGSNQGFVVVSGETGTTAEILGYCDHGSFNYEDAPIQFLDLLNEYSAGIDSLRQDPSLSRAQLPAHIKKAYPSYLGNIVVEPLLTTTWNQTAPYNLHCPTNDSADYGMYYGGHCPAGCVPVAWAQIMNYWKWPKVSRGKIAIGWSQEDGWIYEDFSGHIYDWNNMLDEYNHGYSYEQAEAVSNLLADIGQSMGTQYCMPNGSPTTFGTREMERNFGYEPGSESVTGTTAAAVADALRTELNAGRPVPYVGFPEQGDGHALVCDGYTSNNYFHFNYGWGGATDGFYRLSAVAIYKNNVQIFTGIRPYDAEVKVIGDYMVGIRPTGTIDLVEYLGGGMDAENGAFVIPDSIYDAEKDSLYPVTHIRQTAFFNKGHFTKLTLGRNIEAIDKFSFIQSTIDSLVLNDKMIAVPEGAFQLTGVKHLTIGKNIKRIGRLAFQLCPLNLGIVCKSEGFEVETEAFAHTRPAIGDWTNHITRIQKQAFLGAQFPQMSDFNGLEVLCDSALYACQFGTGSNIFKIGPKVREIAVSAFDGWTGSVSSPVILVDSLNPYFSKHDVYPNIYNKKQTSLILCLESQYAGWPENLVKLEPNCIRADVGSFRIPSTVVDMEGAFSECNRIATYNQVEIACHLPVPPVITDETFNDDMFTAVPNQRIYLEVPEAAEELYMVAPGWRKFYDLENGGIVTTYECDSLPAVNLTYRMVVHSDSVPVKVDLADVTSIRVSEENGEAKVTLSMNDRDDVTTLAAYIDSITFLPGFVFDEAEVFNLNDSVRTAEAHKCTITFDACAYDGDVQVSVRTSVLAPRVLEQGVKGFSVDFTLLTDSGIVHQLSGTARISIPVSFSDKETMHAAYYNPQTGEWEPVYCKYNKSKATVEILTDHLSAFSVFYTSYEHTALEELDAYYSLTPYLDEFNEAVDQLLYLASSDDPEAQQVRQYKDEVALWQAIGLDGFYNMVVSISEPLLNFKPDAIDKTVSMMSYVGTTISILDVIGADIRGDNIAVASGTLSTILNFTTGQLSAAIGTPIMSASMGCVAFIGIALNKFGTTVQLYKTEYYRAAYKYYYSKAGYEAVGTDSKFENDLTGKPYPHSYYRTPKDWFDYFYPAFAEGKMNERQLQAYIEQSVRMYCDRFWEEGAEVQTQIFTDVEMLGYTKYYWDPEAMKAQISNEYFSELMNGMLPLVFTSIKDHITAQSQKRYEKALFDVQKYMNTRVRFKVSDPTCAEGDTSSFAGRRIGFYPLPTDLSDKRNWQTVIGEDGKAELGWFTIFSLIQNGMPFKLILFDKKGQPEKVFDFQIGEGIGKQVIRVKLTGGVQYDQQYLDSLNLVYSPNHVRLPVSGYDMEDHYEEVASEEFLYVHDSLDYYGNVRFRTEVERYFNRHAFITADSTGHYTLGDDITGTFVGDSASGTFIINTKYKFVHRTVQRYVEAWNNMKKVNGKDMTHLLDGIMTHQIPCRYTIKRTMTEEGYSYEVTYSGEGAYDLTAHYINHIGKCIDWTAVVEGEQEPLKVEDVGVGFFSQGGDVSLEYKVTLK